MEGTTVKENASKSSGTIDELEMLLSNSANLIDALLNKKNLMTILQGFRKLVNHFKCTIIGNVDIKTAINWVHLFVQLQRSKSNKAAEHLFLSKHLPTALTYMIGLVDLIPKDQSKALMKILRLMKHSILLTDKVCFKRFSRYTGYIAMIWSALGKVTSFEIQVEILRLIRLMMLRLDVDFVLGEVYSQSGSLDDIKPKILALKETNYNDDHFYKLTRHILNYINANQGFGALVCSFYCEEFTFGEKLNFEKAAHSQLFWFNINTNPRTLTFEGRIQSVEESQTQKVHVSIRIKRFSRQQNKLKIFFIPPASVLLGSKNLFDSESCDFATATLTETEMKRFIKIFRVEEEPLPLPKFEKALPAANVYNEKLKHMANINLTPAIKDTQKTKNQVKQEPEFKMPSIELYRKALSKKKAKTSQHQHNYKEIGAISKTQMKNSKKPHTKSEMCKNPEQFALNRITIISTSLSLTGKTMSKRQQFSDQKDFAPTNQQANRPLSKEHQQRIIKLTTAPSVRSASLTDDESSKEEQQQSNHQTNSQPSKTVVAPKSQHNFQGVLLEHSNQTELMTAPTTNFYRQRSETVVASTSQHAHQLSPTEQHQKTELKAETSSKEQQETQELTPLNHQDGQVPLKKENISGIFISPTYNSKNRFFKNPREPKLISIPWKNSSDKDTQKFNRKPTAKNILFVSPLKMDTDLHKDLPKAAVVNANFNATAESDFQRKRKATLSEIDMTAANKKPCLVNTFAGYLNESCSSEQADKKNKIQLKPASICSPNQFKNSSNLQALQQITTESDKENQHSSSSEFSDAPSPVALDAVFRSLESPTSENNANSKIDDNFKLLPLRQTARRRKTRKNNYFESSSDSDCDIHGKKVTRKPRRKTKYSLDSDYIQAKPATQKPRNSLRKI